MACSSSAWARLRMAGLRDSQRPVGRAIGRNWSSWRRDRRRRRRGSGAIRIGGMRRLKSPASARRLARLLRAVASSGWRERAISIFPDGGGPFVPLLRNRPKPSCGPAAFGAGVLPLDAERRIVGVIISAKKGDAGEDDGPEDGQADDGRAKSRPDGSIGADRRPRRGQRQIARAA